MECVQALIRAKEIGSKFFANGMWDDVCRSDPFGSVELPCESAAEKSFVFIVILGWCCSISFDCIVS